MTFVRTAGILSLLAALAACNGSPLPKGEIPPDFYLFYRIERPFPDSAAAPAPTGKPAAPVPTGKPAAPAPTGKPAGPAPTGKPAGPAPTGKPAGPAPTGKPAGPAPTGKPAAPVGTPPAPKPVLIQIEVESDGAVEYEVHHRSPRPAQWKEQKVLTPETLRKLYEVVADSDLFDMEDKYFGEDESLGTETFYVMGMGRRSKEIIVRGTAVPSLATLRNQILTLTAIRLTPPEKAVTGYVLDGRTGKIHRAACGQVASIPEADRQKSGRVEALVNVRGAFPCEECRPLERR